MAANVERIGQLRRKILASYSMSRVGYPVPYTLPTQPSVRLGRQDIIAPMQGLQRVAYVQSVR
ncbi:hypothetical protein GALMADRAFT_257717 [Galerina marginata CBS 339.88]|uniref:Uncharacterized protein n=1 Tax=Galerina marginata (strain CBS 339.88) TaxID=685588 RepID=A0A067SJF1_GALM3|nr:hypothetical protein GALMADRAFT_257717 [Galerina marginata CBS 339.88]